MSIAVAIDRIKDRLNKIIETAPEELADADRRCDCGACDGYGHIIDEDGRARPCPRALGESRAKAMDAEMGGWEDWPPPRLAEMRARPGFQETKSFLAVEFFLKRIFAGDPPQGLLLCGGHGRSKTLSPLALLRECGERGMGIAAVNFPALIAHYKRGIDGQPSIDRLFRKIEAAKVVFVDELGRDPGWGNADHARFALQEIVGRCYRRRFLIMASNLTRNRLFDSIFPSNVSSRLNPCAGYCAVTEEPFDGDLRETRLWEVNAL
ncbi:MAG: ATP-binding protein [Candidatus Omnitrophota bacterium]